MDSRVNLQILTQEPGYIKFSNVLSTFRRWLLINKTLVLNSWMFFSSEVAEKGCLILVCISVFVYCVFVVFLSWQDQEHSEKHQCCKNTNCCVQCKTQAYIGRLELTN